MRSKVKPTFKEKLIVGDVGEQIAFEHLTKHGWIVYPHIDNKRAPIDFVTMRPKPDGFDVVLVEVKCYPRLYSKNMQGIDSADFFTYKELAKTLPLTLIFIDPFEQSIYALPFAKHYDKAIFEQTKVYFDLELCKPLRKLKPDELRRIGWKPSLYYKDVKKYF